MKRNKEMITIGVFGLHRYVGTTHVALLLAEYFRLCRRKKTAFVELTEHDVLREYEHAWYGRTGSEPVFWRKRCGYWKRARWEVLQEVKEYGSEYCILDLGSDFERNGEHLLACSRKIIVGDCGLQSDAAWEYFWTQPKLQHTICLKGSQDWMLLQNHGVTGKKGTISGRIREVQRNQAVYELGTERLVPMSCKVTKLLEKCK